jgi:molybdenum cofactor synthesis domain-containing protein
MCTIDETRLFEINMIEDIVAATRNNHRPVKAGDIVAGVRVVPLVIEDEKITQVESLCAESSTVRVKPFKPCKIGIVTIGNEVYAGRIKDEFGPVLRRKAEEFECPVLRQYILPDEVTLISGAINNLIAEGAEIVLTTGGMSVDPDDVTPRAIRKTGAEVVTYGAPVLPGSMLMVAYLDNTPILGLPACVMYYQTTVFDLIFPLILSGEKITRAMIARLGMGGLCLNCPECHYPACSFGTGL